MLVRTLALLALPVFLAPGASNFARNRCSDAVRILRSSSVSFDVTQPIGAGKVNNAIAHYNQVVENWKRAGSQIGQVPKNELNPNDPDMADCVNEAKKWGEYLNALAVRIKEAQGAAAVSGPLLEAFAPYKDSFWRMAGAHLSAADVFGTQPAEARKVMDDMAAVATACESKAPNAGASMPVPERSPTVRNFGNVTVYTSLEQNPDAWCYFGKNREAVMAKALGQKNISVPGYGNWAFQLPDARKKFERGETSVPVSVALLMWDPAKMKEAMGSQVQAWYQAAGLTSGGNPFSELDAQIASTREAATKAAANVPFDDAHHDARLEAMGKAAVQKAEPSSKVWKAAMDAAGFTLRTNALGIPLERYRSGRVMIQRPKMPWCEARTFSYVEVHQGGGQYMPPTQMKLTEYTTLVKCP